MIVVSFQLTLSQPYPVEPRDFIGYMITTDQVSSGLSILPNHVNRQIYNLWGGHPVPIEDQEYDFQFIALTGEPALGAIITTNEGEIV